MGTAQSRYESTNWDEADGGMPSDVQCLAGNTPTSSKKTVTLEKKERFNMREFTVKDQHGNIICNTVPVLETGSWFELRAPNGQKLCRLRHLLLRNSWNIYSYLKPAFEGQEPDPDGRRNDVELKATGNEPLYRTYRVEFDLAKNKAEVKKYVPDVSDGRGAPGETVLILEKVKSIKEEYQTSLPGQSSLVSYWDWKDLTIELQVAKGTDLALHAALAVLVNVVKEYEKNPVGWMLH